MLKRPVLPALLLSLTLAAPALGQGPADAPSSREPAPAPQTAGPTWLRDAPATGDFACRAENNGGRKRVVGSFELSENVDLGVGLIEVQHKNPRSRRQRTDPMADVLAPDQKIAAVGLSFRF